MLCDRLFSLFVVFIRLVSLLNHKSRGNPGTTNKVRCPGQHGTLYQVTPPPQLFRSHLSIGCLISLCFCCCIKFAEPLLSVWSPPWAGMAAAPQPALHMSSRDLIKKEPLDYGGFGEVYLCYHVTLGQVVMKTMYTGPLRNEWVIVCICCCVAVYAGVFPFRLTRVMCHKQTVHTTHWHSCLFYI